MNRGSTSNGLSESRPWGNIGCILKTQQGNGGADTSHPPLTASRPPCFSLSGSRFSLCSSFSLSFSVHFTGIPRHLEEGFPGPHVCESRAVAGVASPTLRGVFEGVLLPQKGREQHELFHTQQNLPSLPGWQGKSLFSQNLPEPTGSGKSAGARGIQREKQALPFCPLGPSGRSLTL